MPTETPILPTHTDDNATTKLLDCLHEFERMFERRLACLPFKAVRVVPGDGGNAAFATTFADELSAASDPRFIRCFIFTTSGTVTITDRTGEPVIELRDWPQGIAQLLLHIHGGLSEFAREIAEAQKLAS